MPTKKKSISKKKNSRNGKSKPNGTSNGDGVGKRNGAGNNGNNGVGINERREAIAKLRFGQFLSVPKIARELHVSETTVKNDIKILKDEYIGKDENALKEEVSLLREAINFSFNERVKNLWMKLRENEANDKQISKMIKDLKAIIDKTKVKNKIASLTRQLAKLIDGQRSCQNMHLRIIAQIGETENLFIDQLVKMGVIKRDELPPIGIYQLFGNEHANKSDDEKERELAEDIHIITSGNGTKNNRL